MHRARATVATKTVMPPSTGADDANRSAARSPAKEVRFCRIRKRPWGRFVAEIRDYGRKLGFGWELSIPLRTPLERTIQAPEPCVVSPPPSCPCALRGSSRLSRRHSFSTGPKVEFSDGEASTEIGSLRSVH
ncbi:hypothetical protein U1Q18_039255 [Sarracenia purpurea var. burkii]